MNGNGEFARAYSPIGSQTSEQITSFVGRRSYREQARSLALAHRAPSLWIPRQSCLLFQPSSGKLPEL